jgi:hypothetical protein
MFSTEMKHNLNRNKKNNNTKVAVAAAKVFSLATILVVAAIGVTIMAPLTALASQSEDGFTTRESPMRQPRAPSVVSGDNIYIAWWTNNTENGNEEVMFRASNDAGETFGERINLSTSAADSSRVEIAAEAENVVVSWWETNQTGSDTPVARISTDGGETFGPMLRLAISGTISGTEEEGGATEGEAEGEAEEEEAAAANATEGEAEEEEAAAANGGE